MRWLKRWIHDAMHNYHTNMEGRAPTTMDVLGHMAQSTSTIYRIDNGFIIMINLNSDAHLGGRGACVFAKDAHEVAEKIIAHEAAFKIGVRSGGLNAKIDTAQYAPRQAYLSNAEISKLKGINYV
jgi:hypothetical protein